MSLEGKASNFYTNICQRNDNIEYYDLIQRFEKHFGFSELSETEFIGFNSVQQGPNESLHDWADRLVTLATEAFRYLPEEHMWSQAILRFCHGCYDKETGEKAVNYRPTLEQAIDQVKWAIHTHNTIHGRYKPSVRQVEYESYKPPGRQAEYDSYKSAGRRPEYDNLSVCSVRNQQSRVEALEGKMGEMDKKYDKIMNKLDFICED